MGVEEVQKIDPISRSLIAEFIGTLFLVLIGCGACVTLQGRSTIEIALAFGFVIASAVQCFGHVSGCHINPAVSLGLIACGRIGLLTGLLYIPVQCAGAVSGAGILKYMIPEPQEGGVGYGLGLTKLTEPLTVGQGVAVEAVITALLILVVCAVTDPSRTDLGNAAPLAIGLTISCCHIFAIPFTGAAMNPARALGPAAIEGYWDNHWIYWVGPIFGALAAGIIYRIIFRAKKEDESSYDL